VDISPSELYCVKLESSPKKLCEAEVRVVRVPQAPVVLYCCRRGGG
jgi:hypothetical protein